MNSSYLPSSILLHRTRTSPLFFFVPSLCIVLDLKEFLMVSGSGPDKYVSERRVAIKWCSPACGKMQLTRYD